MILVVGSINMDICLRVKDIPRPGETVLSMGIAKNPGGKGANQAVAAAKLGADITMLGCVGNDEHSEALLKSLSEAGVDTTYIMRKSGLSSSSAFICVSDSGENSIVVDSSANMYVSPEYLLLHENLFQQAEYCIVQMEIPLETVKTAISLSHHYGLKVVLNPSPLNGFDTSLLNNVDYLIPNEEEAATLLGKSFNDASDEDWNGFIAKYGIGNMIITLGKMGSRHYHPGSTPVTYPSKARVAVDTTGAGDTFLGAFVSSIASGCSISDAVRFANTASGISVTRSGAQRSMPTKEEVLKELQNS